MHWQAYTRIVVSLGVAILMAIGSRQHHKSEGGWGIYRFPTVYTYFSIGTFLFFTYFASLPGITGKDPNSIYFFAVFPLCALIMGLFFYRFRLAISGNKVRMGSFRIREFDLDDVTEFKQERGQGAEIVLTLAGGKKIHISGLLTDFDELSDLILARKKPTT